jgi:hypothetical protein
VCLHWGELVISPERSTAMSEAGWEAVERAGENPSAPAPRLYMWPQQSKTCKARRPPMQVVLPQRDSRFCFVRALGQFVVACREARCSLPGQALARPQHAATKGKGGHMTAQNLAGRAEVRKYGGTEAAGIYEGEGCRCFRRGALQDAVQLQCWTGCTWTPVVTTTAVADPDDRDSDEE